MSRHFVITSTDGSKTVFIPFHRLIRVLIGDDVRLLFDDPSSDVISLGRNWGPNENEAVVKTWVKEWIQPDRDLLPGFSDFQVRPLGYGGVIEVRRGYPDHDIGQGIRFWFKARPIGSQFHNQAIFKSHLNQWMARSRVQ